MDEATKIPLTGVGVMVTREGKVLLGKRKNAHGAGEYAFPGGHLEHMEGFEECARREVAEETGIEIENVRFHLLANMTQYAPKHYVHIGMMADWRSGEPRVLEPDKCEGWGWYDPDNLPGKLFAACEMALYAYKNNITFLDKETDYNGAK